MQLKQEQRLRALVRRMAIVSLTVLAGGGAALAQNGSDYFLPGNLVVSRSVYNNNANNVTIGETLPPNCASTQAVAGSCVTAQFNGSYPQVFNNAPIDASFGITSPIFLDQITPGGVLINTLEVPNSLQNGVPPTKDQMVTSFSSKSEVALNLSTGGDYLTFMGYHAPVNAIDVSNANTPAAVDPTNPVGENVFRVVGQVDQHGKFRFTLTNAYSGNNGRAAILNNTGANLVYTAGNAGNGSNPQPDSIIIGTGEQILTPEVKAEVAQSPGVPTPVGSFNVTQLGAKADKIGKDTNFRGLTIFGNVVYTSKGSGSNGVNTVYFVDTTGKACPSTSATPGVGLPQPGATLPSAGLAYDTDPTVIQAQGLVPDNMCILKGFPSTLNSKLKAKTTAYPFGIWFANSTTIYVADEGDGALGDAGATPAGLQKWIFDSATQQWNLAYALQSGLNLGVQYTVPGYPTGINAATGIAWAPEPDGLRNITGRVNGDGTVTIWGITSTVSGGGDQGADPNQLVSITDTLSYTTKAQAAGESFTLLKTAGFGEVLRGVAFTPGTSTSGTIE